MPTRLPTALTPPAHLREFLRAARGWFEAFGILRKYRLQAYHLAGPAVLLCITMAGAGLTQSLADALRDAVTSGLSSAGLDLDNLASSPDAWYSDALLWGASKLDWMLEWGLSLLVFWLKLKLTKYLLLTLMAPVMSALAGAIRQRETGTSTPFTVRQLLRDLYRGVRMSVALLAAELGLSLGLAVIGLLLTVFAAPVAVLLSPVLLVTGWAVGAYFYGAAVFDAVYEQAELDWRASLSRGWAERGRLLGIGSVFSLLLAVPLLGVFLATFLGPIPCTAAAARLTFTPDS